jgi:carboxyl-terminal processing protease
VLQRHLPLECEEVVPMKFGCLMLFCTSVLSSVAIAADASPPSALSLRDLAGVWQMQGYGTIFDISADRVVRYDMTDISCARIDERPFAQARSDFDRIEARHGGYRYFEPGGITRYAIDRLPEVPQRCSQSAEKPIRDPQLNLWVLWHAFRENYAFFDLHQVDWEQIAARFRSDLSATSSDAELLQKFSGMLQPLNDGHVRLTIYGQRRIFSGGAGELRRLWMAEAGVTDLNVARTEFAKVANKYVIDDVLKGKATQGANGAITWGWLTNGVGYLNVATMSPELPAANDHGPALPTQLALVDDAMTRALKHLRRARILVVDARFNHGGEDAVALRIMGHVTAQKRLAFTKKAVMGNGYTEPQEIYIEPAGKTPFTGPILYLQSGNTISAAEIFTLAMMALPNVTRIGTPTYGVLSDTLNKRLPNGWWVSLSNEVYVAVDGELYEGRGIPPMLAVDTAGVKNFRERLQRDIDVVLKQVHE